MRRTLSGLPCGFQLRSRDETSRAAPLLLSVCAGQAAAYTATSRQGSVGTPSTMATMAADAHRGGAVRGQPPTESLAPGIFYVDVPDALGYHGVGPGWIKSAPATQSPPHLDNKDREAPRAVAEEKQDEHCHRAGERGVSDGISPQRRAHRASLEVGGRSPTFMVSTVYEWGGVLWQWRAVRAKPTSVASPSHDSGADYVMVPFILHPNASRRASCARNTPRAGASSSPHVFVDRSTSDLVFTANAVSPPTRGTTRRSRGNSGGGGGGAEAAAVFVPYFLGDARATVVSCAEHAMKGTYTPPYSPDGDEEAGHWVRDCLHLLQRGSPSATAGSPAAGVGGPRHSAPATTYEYVCRVRTGGGETRAPNVGHDTRHALCVERSIECNGASHTVDREMDNLFRRASRGTTPVDAHAGCDVAHTEAVTDNHLRRHPGNTAHAEVDEACHTAASLCTPQPGADEWIPVSHRNVITGGVAEVILSVDTYAALIARRELTLAAACWAILCDTRSSDVLWPLRTHALEIEREVQAAVEAHEALQALALARRRTLVGKNGADLQRDTPTTH